ncbi:hypothetical protein CIHG_10246 [Coccidioides immitis H538.4]|uniref:Uncharacterized protein n=1 Tax=Coccidioides immitis H538.4 TaxID=396776 RepID=A0A0J8S6C6_COCIT|nr:hypothetical protein CIHG_10246 [Coccidioides immitis H538.4]
MDLLGDPFTLLPCMAEWSLQDHWSQTHLLHMMQPSMKLPAHQLFLLPCRKCGLYFRMSIIGSVHSHHPIPSPICHPRLIDISIFVSLKCLLSFPIEADTDFVWRAKEHESAGWTKKYSMNNIKLGSWTVWRKLEIAHNFKAFLNWLEETHKFQINTYGLWLRGGKRNGGSNGIPVQNGAELLLFYISGFWLVSLFDTPMRGKPPLEGEPWLKKHEVKEQATSSWFQPSLSQDNLMAEDLTDNDVSTTESKAESMIFSKVSSTGTHSSYLKAMQLNHKCNITGGKFDPADVVEDEMQLDNNECQNDSCDFDPADLIMNDESTVTNNGCHAGDKTKGLFLWQHICFYIICGKAPQQPNFLLAKESLCYYTPPRANI